MSLLCPKPSDNSFSLKLQILKDVLKGAFGGRGEYTLIKLLWVHKKLAFYANYISIKLEKNCPDTLCQFASETHTTIAYKVIKTAREIPGFTMLG